MKEAISKIIPVIIGVVIFVMYIMYEPNFKAVGEDWTMYECYGNDEFFEVWKDKRMIGRLNYSATVNDYTDKLIEKVPLTYVPSGIFEGSSYRIERSEIQKSYTSYSSTSYLYDDVSIKYKIKCDSDKYTIYDEDTYHIIGYAEFDTPLTGRIYDKDHHVVAVYEAAPFKIKYFCIHVEPNCFLDETTILLIAGNYYHEYAYYSGYVKRSF